MKLHITILTVLKCVADCTFRTGCIRASRTTILISAPEYLLEEYFLEIQINYVDKENTLTKIEQFDQWYFSVDNFNQYLMFHAISRNVVFCILHSGC